MTMNNYSYVALISEDSYLLGLLCLRESLKNTKTEIPLSVIVTENVSRYAKYVIKKSGMNVINREKFLIPNEINARNKGTAEDYWSNTFDKLYVFELTQFEKIVYLDSDMYILKNIDHLFNKEHLSAVIAGKYYKGNENWTKLNSGLMVIKPQKNVIDKFRLVFTDILKKRKAIGDQDIIQETYPDWDNNNELHLDDRYNMFFYYLEYYINELNYKIEDISVIHFITKIKPWLLDEANRRKYLKIFESSKNSYKIICDYLGILDNIKKDL